VGNLIDSSVLIATERGQLDLAAAMRDHASDQFAISAVTASELLHGVHRANGPIRARRSRYVEEILNRLPVLAFDLHCARIHAELSAEARSSGKTIGNFDAMIAATALTHGHAVITRDLRSFPRITGITVVHW
jgi:tRNA(fMet)-specific endonuclease VapC